MDDTQASPALTQANMVTNTPKFNWIIGVLLVLLFIVSIFGAYFFGTSKSTTSGIIPSPSQIPPLQPSPTETPVTLSPTLEPTPNTTTDQAGSVTGKLCYPAEGLPKGTIEAKNTVSGETTVQDYPGSAAGGKSSYSFDLVPGNYFLRYKVSDTLVGYHTETCKTGSEMSCAATNPRVLIAALVESGKTIVDYDLCDFYYDNSTKPTF